MFDYLEGYLDTFTTPETGTLILNAAKTLLDYGIDDHLFPLRNELDRAENETHDIVAEGLVGVLIPFYIRAIREMGVTMDPDSDLEILYSTFSALTRIEDWEDKDSINVLTQAVEGVEAALSDILQVVGDKSSDEYLQWILEVNPDVLKRISEITVVEEYNELPSPVLVAGAQMRLRGLFEKIVFNEESPFVKALDGGLRLGLPLELAIKPSMESISELPVSDLGRELVAFAFASSIPNDKISAALSLVRETLDLSVLDQMQLDQEIKRLL